MVPNNLHSELLILTRKITFFEEKVQEDIESYTKSMELDELKKSLATAKNYVFTVHIKQLLSHLDWITIFDNLPHLKHLDVTYGYTQLPSCLIHVVLSLLERIMSTISLE